MEERYREAIEAASQCLSEVILRDMETLLENGHRLDGLVKEILRWVGLAVMHALYGALCTYLVRKATRCGLTVQSRAMVCFKTLFGDVEVESPYLWDAESGASARPMKEVLGIAGKQYSESLQRALVDFGSEKSFARAALRFKEHYGFEVGRTTLRNLTLQAARSSERYVDSVLFDTSACSDPSLAHRPRAAALLVELDGCEIRTGVMMTAAEAGMSDRSPQDIVRQERWRDVRTGLVGPLGTKQRLYVCRLGSYREVCNQLYAAACGQGLTSRTDVVIPGDGAPGLREALQVPFPKAQYILDRPHLKSHFYETATELGIDESERAAWVSSHMKRLWNGNIRAVLKKLRTQQKDKANERLRRLIDYVERFKDCVHYGAYKARGWPLGSGEVESAHRYVPQERLKIAGACWHPDNVNPMLALRVIRANHWWDDFWQWRLRQKQVKAAA
jgi:hypothetical protein